MTRSAPSRFFGSPAALRRMIAGQRQAARAGRAVGVKLTAEQSFDAAQELWALCPERVRRSPDRVRAREVEQARLAWKKLKARFVAPPLSPKVRRRKEA